MFNRRPTHWREDTTALHLSRRLIEKTTAEYFMRAAQSAGCSGTDDTRDYFINIVKVRESLSGFQSRNWDKTGLNIPQDGG